MVLFYNISDKYVKMQRINAGVNILLENDDNWIKICLNYMYFYFFFTCYS